MSDLTFERYLQTLKFSKFFKDLGVQNVDVLAEQIRHFTEKEAEKRDAVVLSYFGANGVYGIMDSVVDRLLSPPRLSENAEILDVGAGTGFFTIKIAQKLQRELSEASFYALDVTPAMLRVLAKKTTRIIPFLGVAENISTSVNLARKHLKIPEKFDAVYSILTLHHCLKMTEVFRSLREVLKTDGKAVVVDLCEHPFEEFRREMGDIHLGFKPGEVKEKALNHFSMVQVEKMSGIRCESSGRCAELFIALMIS
jgi:ubiquinone/menaquinone biosynthesis C-methylase UbiE